MGLGFGVETELEKGVGIEADFIDSHQHPFYFMLTLLPCALLFPSMSSFNSELPLFFPF